jgi:hypothetical protein
MNLPVVKEALHVDSSIEWVECSDPLFNNWPEDESFEGKFPLSQNLLHNNTQLNVLLIFSGDTDIICSTIGTQHWIFRLGLEVHCRCLLSPTPHSSSLDNKPLSGVLGLI